MSAEADIRAAFSAWNEGGVDAFLEHVSPGIEWRHPPGFPQGDVWQGRDELRREMHDQFEDLFDTGTVDLRSIERAPEGWLVEARHAVQARSSGMDLWWDAWFVWTVEDGLITRSLVFLNRQAAERAAGVLKHAAD
jgi:ketosteroid isomerase-like protein